MDVRAQFANIGAQLTYRTRTSMFRFPFPTALLRSAAQACERPPQADSAHRVSVKQRRAAACVTRHWNRQEIVRERDRRIAAEKPLDGARLGANVPPMEHALAPKTASKFGIVRHIGPMR
jgi:hypothetical protein